MIYKRIPDGTRTSVVSFSVDGEDGQSCKPHMETH